MIQSALVSISFRSLGVEEIITLAAAAKLAGIEWGSDVHVPAGDLERAAKVSALMAEQGLETFAYGSYYRVGENSKPAEDFQAYLASALALGAPCIRVWAGKRASVEADDAYRQAVLEDTRIICELAAEHEIEIAFEYHPNTLTDDRYSAIRLFQAVDQANLKLYWQPNFALSEEENLDALEMVLPYLRDVHVFSWYSDHSRRELAACTDLWQKYLDLINRSGHDHRLMLEFVKDDKPEQLLTDAETLNQWLGQLNS